MRKIIELFLIFLLWAIVFYAVHVVSFVTGFNLSTDKQYDRFHYGMEKDGLTGNEILEILHDDKGPFLIEYPYAFYRVFIIERDFNWKRLADWIHIRPTIILNLRDK